MTKEVAPSQPIARHGSIIVLFLFSYVMIRK